MDQNFHSFLKLYSKKFSKLEIFNSVKIFKKNSMKKFGNQNQNLLLIILYSY